MTDSVLLAAAFLHLGFQATVTALVYPNFALVTDADWPAFHAAHSRRITPVVAVVYGLVVVAGVMAVVDGTTTWRVVGLTGHGIALLTTALVAAPAHGRLGSGRAPDVLARLVAADRVRLAGATVAAVAAVGTTIVDTTSAVAVAIGTTSVDATIAVALAAVATVGAILPG